MPFPSTHRLPRLSLFALALAAPPTDDWPAWRGPDGTGVAASAAPTTWSDTENVKWKVAIPGRGFSTPIALGARIFLTTAVSTGEEPQVVEEDGGDGRSFARVVPTEQAFVVLCLDRESGAVQWEKRANVATPHEGYHRQYGSWASYSPVTDGERLYVSFGTWGIYCYTLEGELVWKTDLGVEMEMRRQFGEGSAPVVHGDTLVQVLDQEGDSLIVALDKKTGKERWRAARDEPSSWAMPVVAEVGGVAQVITSATNAVRSYRLADGELIWTCSGLGANAIPAPLLSGDTVVVMTGYRDPNMMAIRLGGKGDLSGTEAVLWQNPKGCPYTAAPVLHDGKIYAAMDRGFLSCFDARTGEATYREERLPRGTSLKASPVAAGEHLYVATESGEVHVVKLGPEFELVATNTLADQFFVASPVVVDGEMLLRSETHLFCIAEEEGE